MKNKIELEFTGWVREPNFSTAKVSMVSLKHSSGMYNLMVGCKDASFDRGDGVMVPVLRCEVLPITERVMSPSHISKTVLANSEPAIIYLNGVDVLSWTCLGCRIMWNGECVREIAGNNLHYEAHNLTICRWLRRTQVPAV